MKLIEQLSRAVVEKDVENTWRAFLSKQYKCDIKSPYNSDGYFEHEDARVLCEFKDDIDMGDSASSLGVIAQCLYYLKKFQEDGAPLPSVILGGDRNECFVTSASALVPYLSKPYNWNVAPCEASTQLLLMSDLIKDENVVPVVFKLNNNFNFDSVRHCIQNTALGARSDTPITSQNIVRVFEYWVNNVLNEPKMDKRDICNTFLTLLCQPQDCYPHPKKPQFVVIEGRDVRVKPKMYRAFFTLYKETRNPLELRDIVANKDRLFQEIHRRRTGAFFTPSIWVDEAHKMIAEQFGEDWKEKYVVWDCSCGTLNLTRDYVFKELYCSTISQSDLDLATSNGFNPEAVKFKLDFLNDLDETHLPEGLRRAFAEKRPILFLNNPPYGTANEFGATGADKAGIAAMTVMNAKMKEDEIGACSQQLYAQFLYRQMQMVKTHGLTDCGLAVFTVPGFMTGGTFKDFRKEFLGIFAYKSGMLFQASHFADVSDTWGISFTLFGLGQSESQTEFALQLKNLNEGGRVVTFHEKVIYNLDDSVLASEWVREPVKGQTTHDAPQMTSGTAFLQDGRGRLVKDALGYLLSNANDCNSNLINVSLFSSCPAKANGLSVIESNFDRVIALFTARKLITPNWINQKDEYKVPNTNHLDYQQWLNDALVYSLFNTSSNQSSLRQVDYKGKKRDIQNHFFFMSLAEIEQLAVKHSNNSVYNDCKSHPPDRFVYQHLQEINLSPDAQEVLDMARDLVKKSFPLRTACNDVSPEFHINTWDAGWYQIKNGLLKTEFRVEYAAFVLKYKALEERLREGVYMFGFLRR